MMSVDISDKSDEDNQDDEDDKDDENDEDDHRSLRKDICNKTDNTMSPTRACY